MASNDDRPNAFAAPASDLAASPAEPKAEESDVSLIWAASQLSRARFWIWCMGAVLLTLSLVALAITLYLAFKTGELQEIVAHAAVMIVYGSGGLIAWRINNRVGIFLDEPDGQHLEEVFQAENEYWMYWGILSFVGVGVFAWLLSTLFSRS